MLLAALLGLKHLILYAVIVAVLVVAGVAIARKR